MKHDITIIRYVAEDRPINIDDPDIVHVRFDGTAAGETRFTDDAPIGRHRRLAQDIEAAIAVARAPTLFVYVANWLRVTRRHGTIARAAGSLKAPTSNAEERNKLKQSLDRNDMYLYTANAFSCGSFKHERAGEQVDGPDARSDGRCQSATKVADLGQSLA